jgi:hypothetical protein
MHAIRIDYRNYQSVKNVAQIMGEGHKIGDMASMSQKFAVIRTDPIAHEQVIEIYDETDFRTFFKWVDGGSATEFKEVVEVTPDEEGEIRKWEPPHLGDLGAV